MKIKTLLFAVACGGLAAFSHADSSTLALMPWPSSVQTSEQSLPLKALPNIRVTGADSETLQQAIARFKTQLAKQNNLTAGEAEQTLHIEVASKHSALLQTDAEAYQLTVNADGIELTAATTMGAQRGMQTLLQLAASNNSTLPGVTIKDSPRFAWRGLLLDSVRHFFSVDTIKRQLDGMAAAKLNVFHWHLTDDQGWRLESKAYPKLHQSNQDGHYYTQAQIKDVIAYAAARGIYVLPEIDMPGHASAIAVAYPELMSAPGPYQHEDRWGVHKPLLNPANPEVYTFAQKILAEVAELFPFPYVHIGGDEVDPEHWESNEQIQAFRQQHKLADSHALHAYFNQRLAEILTELDRKMIGWDEVLHPDLPQGTVVQSWQGPDALGRAINMGYPALLSTGFYLDQPQYASYHHRVRLLPEPIRIATTPGNDEPWSSWEFTAPRKRGSAISGSITVLGEGDSLRGFIDFKNKSRQVLRDLSYANHTLSFAVDTWMGPVNATLDTRADTLSGVFVTGNAPYEVTGSKSAGHTMENSSVPTPVGKDLVSPDKENLLLGGEAALWTEIIDENSIDLRLWPRGFVVAERLWSKADVRDQDSMYQRLDKISEWAADSVGLQHFAEQKAALQKLYPTLSQDNLLSLSSAMEPAHYYHRHHEKSVNETYSRRDPLNRFVDSLPSESIAVRQFRQNINAWLHQPENKALQQSITAQLQSWRRAAQKIQSAKLENAYELNQLSDNLLAVSEIGLQEVERIAEGKPAHASKQQQLEQALSIQHEVILAAAFGVQTLRNFP
ncbi:beta-N-acetylhexosaminidase [Gilvimarinus sp. DA14]|uniref:beta-N-acetylhexosaminidase n=1 Tax=Gilvimarinus sp. DA14 TaxID=2956798 RepID=UPI0020B808B7|nr:family 20 glycosylhydrolase [Gilvimarinus sp. DA14]UTF58788.1 beta-N-acetylhexosaminidase [Gilvimarinus sp. DA14]